MISINKKQEDSGITAVVKSIFFMILFIILLVICGLIRSAFQPIYNMLIYGSLGSIVGFFAVWIFLRVGKKSFSSIGLVWEKKTPQRFILGIIIGLAIFILIFFVLLVFSGLTIHYHPDAFSVDALFMYLSILPLALMEEIGFRSYPMVKLNKAYGIWASQLIIAIAFGAYHILNGWSVYSSFTGPFVWSFVFGLAALWSRGIALPTGIHLALNVLQNLSGMKGNKGAVWLLDYPPGTSKVLMDRTDKIGLMIQIAILLVALIATAWYARKKKSPISAA